LQRQWKRFLNADFANLAEHHFRVAWLALLIAKHEKAANTDKVLKMALVHDIAESRTNDVDYLSRQYVVRNEELGIKDMAKDTVFGEELVALWQEYEKRESIEAKIVKDADNLDVDMELLEQGARGMSLSNQKVWKQTRVHVHDHKLSTKTAKRIWKALQTSNPHDWHINGRTRLNAGDWKK